ncbi:MAG: trehalose-phosphatase [Terracidiphilus sp.]
MEYILSSKSVAILSRLARERTLCALDFDGTLSSIVDRPDEAAMRARTRELLIRLASLYPCIVISGRSRRDVIKKLHGIRVTGVFGNHGAENPGGRRLDRRATQWKTALQAQLGSLSGVWIEDKGTSLAVHYRQSARQADSRRRILAAIAGLKRVRAFGGKAVVNVVADDAPTKGDAVAAERDRLRCNWVLVVGDDETDEDAFALDGNVVSVRIGSKRQSRARYYLRTQAEIDLLLKHLIRLRTASSG